MVLLAAALVLAPAPLKWVSLFDGKTLKGWSPKIVGHKFGENFGNTFRVANGVIQVNYDQYAGKFEGRFGHLFYKNPYSSYILRLEYRFTGEQISDGPGWAWRNSGIMIHCQDPKLMRIDQDFPVSAEVQLLGGPEKETRHTANLCTPGTNVMMGGRLITQHCNDSVSDTYRGDRWVKVEVEVHGSRQIVHRVEGKDVLTYEGIQFDPNDPDGKRMATGDSLLIEKGFISLQSESHPCEFRNIQLMELPK